MTKKNKKLHSFFLKSRQNFSQSKNNKGFTLIEIMVSVAIFAIIMTTGIGALVSITNSYRVSQQNKQVNDALNFSLESITRELRLGQNYYVPNSGQVDEAEVGSSDGDNDSIGFNATDGRGYFIFRYNEDNLSLERETIDGSVGNNTAQLTNPDLVEITSVQFMVIGTDSVEGSNQDVRQPLVWIRIQAKPTGESDDSISTIQTLVSQRSLDI
jgi:prepilin-type N-terminal cleavage/methylation domain-containing protein